MTNHDNLFNKIAFLEKEKINLAEDLKEKEEYYRNELEKLEKSYESFQKVEFEKFESEKDAHQNTKKKLADLECKHILNLKIVYKDKLESDIKILNKKNVELSNKADGLEEYLQSLNSKNKSYDLEYTKLEKKYFELEKNFKKSSYEKNSTYELIIKMLRSKLNAIRSEINNIKNYSKSEITQIKKESEGIIEGLYNKFKQFNVNFEKDLDLSIRRHKESIETEFIKRLDQKEKENRDEVAKINKKFEKHLMEEYRTNEKLEKEKNQAVI